MRSQVVSLVAVVGLAASARAQTDIPWIAGSGNWSTVTNWMGSNVPDNAGERAVISAAGSYTVSINSSYTVNGLIIPNSMAAVELNNAQSLTLAGASPVLDLTGTFTVNPTGGGNATIVQFNDSGTIQGSGALVLNAHPANLNTAYLQTGAGAVITNAPLHFIRGTGAVHASMINNGLIVGDIDTRTMILTSNNKTNNDRIEARNGGTLQISSISLTQAPTAHVRAEADSFVVLNSATIVGGAVEAMGTGLITVANSSTFSGVNDLLGQLDVSNAQILTIVDGLRNRGTITVNPLANGNATIVQIANSGTLQGEGQIVLNAHPANLDTAYVNTGAGQVLTQAAPHAIRGTGAVHAAMVNDSLISANVTGRTLRLASSNKTNNATIEATSGATLQISSITLTQNNPGRLLADASTLLLDSCSIAGGEISAINGGLVRVLSSSSLTNLATLLGPVEIPNAQTLSVGGGLSHSGTITINPTADGNATILHFTNSGTLGGDGTVVLNSHPANGDTAYLQTGAGAVMTQGPSHLVRGTGRIHANFVNNGTVSADLAGRTIELLSSNKVNNALMQATGGATLQVSPIVLTQGPMGQLLADASTLNLSSCTIVGGTIRATSGGVARVIGSSAFTDVASLEGPLEINNSQSLSVSGGLNHSGTITINPSAGGNATLMQFNTSSVLGGPGDVLLNSHPANLDTAYLQTGAGSVMTHAAGHLIHGTGRIHGVLVNEGTVRADVAGRTIELVSQNKTNNALLEAVGGATLQISSIMLTQGAGGVISADNATVNLASCTIVGGAIQATNGGIVRVVGSSVLTDVVSVAGPVEINNAISLVVNGGLTHSGTIVVNPTAGGNGTLIQFNTTADLAGPGVVRLNAHPANFDSGYLQTGGGAVMTNAPGHTVAGRGRIHGNFVNNGIISPGDDAGDLTSHIQRVGSLVCGSTSHVVADLDGTAQGDTYDWFQATGPLNLAGSLTVRLAPGYLPPRNTVFAVVSASSISGQFSSVTLPTLPPTLGYPRIEYTPTEVRVRVPQCPTDWNARDGINSQDFFDFLSDFFGGTADFNFDGLQNSQDFFDFLTSFFGGCEG
ncbi:MAG: beta strand repeat-containing protein [Phycisphaerales bacterium]